jgi:hypothetical protein
MIGAPLKDKITRETTLVSAALKDPVDSETLVFSITALRIFNSLVRFFEEYSESELPQSARLKRSSHVCKTINEFLSGGLSFSTIST